MSEQITLQQAMALAEQGVYGEQLLSYSGPVSELTRVLRKRAFQGLDLSKAKDLAKIQCELNRTARRAETLRILEARDLRDGGIA